MNDDLARRVALELMRLNAEITGSEAVRVD
jgi:hypothetical protein